MKPFIIPIGCLSCLLFPLSSIAQMDQALGFLNYRRSIPSNFINGEFQLGNSAEMHFLTISAGVNSSQYHSTDHCPYFTGTVELDYNYHFSGYESTKKGIQAGIGYTYYFKNLENQEEFIPVFGIEMNWLLNKDRYTLAYTHQLNGDRQTLDPKTAKFQTLSCETQFGFIYGWDKLFLKASGVIGFYLPVNTSVYMASDGYNAYSGYELPLAGLEPSLQLGIGLKIG